jgi:uncharacterized membrane protein YphA (DoxX/SURF4 family)
MTHYFGVIAILFGLTLLLVTLSSWLSRSPIRTPDTPNTPARIFLVLLRVVIGWHCFVEGMDKLHNPAWSSEAYLRESVGPLAGTYRWLAGDRLLDRLVGDKDQAPPGLALDFDAYTTAFVAHHGLTGKDAERAEDVARQGKSKAVTWLTSGTEVVTKIAAYPPALKIDMTMSQRLEEYNRLQARVAEAEQMLPTSDKDILKRYTDAKANLNKWRGELKKSYEVQYAGFKKSLLDVLTPEQKKDATPVPEPVRWPMPAWGVLEWSDLAVEWGLIVIGAGLMVGLFSRLCSFAGALLILSFFLAMPPLPGWPESPRLEGHYLFLNKTFIEVLALAALTFLPTGRWAGIDSFLPLLWPGNWVRTGTTKAAVTERGRVQPVA